MKIEIQTKEPFGGFTDIQLHALDVVFDGIDHNKLPNPLKCQSLFKSMAQLSGALEKEIQKREI